MTDRHFRLLLGLVLLVLLYLDQFTGIGILITFMLFEALTNWRLPRLTNSLFGRHPQEACCIQSMGLEPVMKIPFEAERMWRLSVSTVLWLSVFAFPESVWWLGWFVAFTVMGAGVSGVCPMLIAFRLAGFR